MSKYSIAQVNNMNNVEFIGVFGGVYEHSGWIAQKVWHERPFDNFNALLESFKSVVNLSSYESKLNLLKAHPELAGKAARAGELTRDSELEQASAGLNNLSAEEMAFVQQFNGLYKAAFDFPFIVAVKKHSKEQIFEQMEARLKNCLDDEFAEALSQVDSIAQIRLNQLVSINS